MLQFLLGALVAALVSGAAFYFFKKSLPPVPPTTPAEPPKVFPKIDLSEAERKAQDLIAAAENKAREIKDKVLETEERLNRREESLEQRAGNLEKREERLAVKEEQVEKKRIELETELERRAALTKEEAREKLLESLKGGLVAERSRLIREAEDDIEAEVDQKAREVLVTAMERAATDYVSESTVSTLKLPSEEVKGRIIGREGRNIKALERATGVDFDIDETPEEVRLSSFDPVRREVAKRALERLIVEGRIQPARIEETVARVREDMDREIKKMGKDLAYAAGVSGLPSELLDLLGRLRFRTSFGQNQAEHTLEVVNLARALAREVGAREDLVAKAALLHDIGKVRTVEEEGGSHVDLGRTILTQFHLGEEVIHTAVAHHRDEPFKNVEAALVYIADAISGSRPGARFEDYETYIQRVGQLEEIAKGFFGVQDAFAIAAGREVRVIVKPEEISDDAAVVLAHDIVGKISADASYPGTVKVNVIRELRVSDVAK